jgi:hypothetical protein
MSLLSPSSTSSTLSGPTLCRTDSVAGSLVGTNIFIPVGIILPAAAHPQDGRRCGQRTRGSTRTRSSVGTVPVGQYSAPPAAKQLCLNLEGGEA